MLKILSTSFGFKTNHLATNIGALILLIALFILPTALNARQIVIGVRSYYPPFEMIIDRNNKVSGFEVDLLSEICRRIHAECSFKPFKFENLFNAVKTNEITLAAGAIIITEERQKEFLFSLPYLSSKGQFVAKSTNKIESISEICDNKIGMIEGSIFKISALSKCGNSAKIVEYPQVSDVYKALENDKIATLITDEEGAHYWVANNNNSFKLVSTPIITGMGYGAMANPNEIELINNINIALMNIENDGTYLKIYNEYFNQ